MRLALALLSILVAVLGPASAQAKKNGVVSKSNMGGLYCNDCHFKGTGNTPTVEFDGPQTVASGDKNTYSFTVTRGDSSQTAAGLDVAASGGTLAKVSDGTQATTNAGGFLVDNAEITHTSPQAYTDGAITFQFDWTAPKKKGTYTLYGAGNSVNEDGFSSGDDPNITTLDVTVTCHDNDSDGHEDSACGGDDCDDNDASVHPGTAEICDGKDQDCNGKIDDGLQTDADKDKHATPDSCPTGALPIDDCDDTKATVHPGATEVCDGLDNDCDGSKGAGEVDADGDGYMVCKNDCNDADPAIHPGATEICGDGIDQDCNGMDLKCICPDADHDGFKDAKCGGTDCNDDPTDPMAASIHPNATEICDGIDQDCDNEADEGLSPDVDGDGHFAIGSCKQPADDCDDTKDTVHPGATEICGDTIDQDCDGSDLVCPECQPGDTKRCYTGPAKTEGCGLCVDGTYACVDGKWGTTCNGEVTPTAEICGNGLDENCNDEADDGCGMAGSGGSGGSTGNGGTGGTIKQTPPSNNGSGGGCNAAGAPAGALVLALGLLVSRARGRAARPRRDRGSARPRG